MEFVIAIAGTPLLLGLLCLGVGLLVDRLSGGWLPAVLILPVGYAGLVGITQLTIASTAIAPVTVVAAPAVAVAGLLVGRARLRAVLGALRSSPWAVLVMVGAYLVAIAPVLLAWRTTLPAYLLDSTVGVQLAGADRLVEHGRDFASLPESSYRLYLEAYFGSHYPSGAHVVLGVLGRLLPVDLLWLYQPYLAFLLALAAATSWWLLRRFGAPKAYAAIGAILCAAPALVYAYVLMGAIKETAVIPLLLLLLALVVQHERWLRRDVRALLPLAATSAAGVGCIGPAFAAWLAVAAAVLLVVVGRDLWARRLRPGALAAKVVALAAMVALLALPTVTDFAASLSLASNLSQSNPAFASDPGNLLQPLHWFQVFGVWLHGSHRVDPPEHYPATLSLLTVVGLAAGLGLIALGRRRHWSALAFVAGMFLVWWVLTQRGTMWTDAKLIVVTSPVVVLLACLAASELAAAGRRGESVMVLALVALGVLWSDALLYHDTNLAPTARFDEQQAINARFAGQGPALLTDFDEYALYELRAVAPSSPGLARRPGVLATYSTGEGVPYGSSVDLDTMSLDAVRAFRLLIVRRSPERSLPPSGYELAWRGEYYDVWRRTAAADRVRMHVGTNAPDRAVGRMPCRLSRAAARAAERGGELVVADRPRTLVLDPRKATVSGDWAEASPSGLGVVGQGRLDAAVDVARPGAYRLWLKGDIGRPFDVLVDGRRIGSIGYQTGGQGNYAAPLRVTLEAGRHRLTLLRGGGNFAPGNGHSTLLAAIVLEPAWPGSAPRKAVLSGGDWRRGCSGTMDWLEAVTTAPGGPRDSA